MGLFPDFGGFFQDLNEITSEVNDVVQAVQVGTELITELDELGSSVIATAQILAKDLQTVYAEFQANKTWPNYKVLATHVHEAQNYLAAQKSAVTSAIVSRATARKSGLAAQATP